MPRRTRLVIIASALTVVALGGCGGDSDTKPAAAGAPTTCGKPGRTVTVEIGKFVFDPTPVDVTRCDSVVWKNSHDQTHTSTGNGAQKWSTGNIAPGETSAKPVQFPTAGTFTYMCALHPFMKGTVTVRA